MRITDNTTNLIEESKQLDCSSTMIDGEWVQDYRPVCLKIKLGVNKDGDPRYKHIAIGRATKGGNHKHYVETYTYDQYSSVKYNEKRNWKWYKDEGFDKRIKSIQREMKGKELV